MGTRIFVGGLSHRVRQHDLEKFFRKYGRIKEVAMKNGFAFVEFDDYRDADDAVYEMNGKELMGERVSVERARGTPRGSDQWRGTRNYGYYEPPAYRSSRPRPHDKYGPPTRTQYRLLVENLSSRISWQDLKDIMRQAGEVTFADAHKRRLNEGVVEFSSYAEMKTAYETLDGTELNGRRIKLIKCKDRGRSSSGSRSRSRSPRRKSRTRSRSRRRASRSRSKRSSRSKSQERYQKKSRSRSKSKSRDHSKTKSRSRSRSKVKQSVSPKSNGSKGRSRSRSVSRGQSKSRSISRSPTKEGSANKKSMDN